MIKRPSTERGENAQKPGLLAILPVICALILAVSISGCASPSTQTTSTSNYTGNDFTSWDDARLGIFIHWSHSSQQGIEVSWPMAGGNASLPLCQKMTVDQYQSTAATFNPTKWDPVAMAKLFKAAGAQYAVVTARHHDGYSMYDTRLSDFSIMNSPFHRDVVRGFIDAIRGQNMGVGVYYSLSDWHHPDYPPFKDSDKPYRYYLGAPLPAPETWQKYLDYMHGQVRELLTNYGRIDEIWFDGQWEHKPVDWKTVELATEIRRLQPGIRIDDRLTGQGDFVTPENFLPATPPAKQWETCLTMNDSWAYNKDDANYKSSTEIIQTLCEIAGKGGHLLLSVSPMGDGQLPQEQVARLNDLAAWMARNHDSIAGTKPGLEPWQFYGPSTQKDNTLFLHLLYKPDEAVRVRSVHVNKIKSVRVLGSGLELKYSSRTTVFDQVRKEMSGFDDPVGDLIIQVPEKAIEPHVTVIAVESNP
ncbi:MAG: alpha-L-fucosidase [Syntrophales bacterium]|nr:alpha-L-fucosidase [Syntrophales bacterium]